MSKDGIFKRLRANLVFEDELMFNLQVFMNSSVPWSCFVLQVVPRSSEPLGGRESTDSVQGELLPGEEQPDLPERLLSLTQVETPAHTLTPAVFQMKIISVPSAF